MSQHGSRVEEERKEQETEEYEEVPNHTRFSWASIDHVAS